MKKAIFSALLAVAAVGAAQAAEPSKFYAGGSVGVSSTDYEHIGTETDPSVGVFVGYQAHPLVAAEVSYTRLANQSEVAPDTKVNLNALTFAAKYDVPQLKDYGVFVKAGAAYTKVGKGEYEQGWTPVFGAGVEHKLAPDLKLRAELQYLHDVGGVNARVANASVGLAYQF